jgi:hypothetical protein
MERKKQEDWETPPDTEGLSVREGRKTRAVWEEDRCQEMIAIGMDPLARADAIVGSRNFVSLLRRPEGIASSMEIGWALSGGDQSKYFQPAGKIAASFASLGCGYTMKLTAGRGMGRTRYFSRQAVCIVGMQSTGPSAHSFRAWMAEVVTRASKHPDFADLMDWRHPERAR